MKTVTVYIVTEGARVIIETMKVAAKNEEGACLYRTPDGRKCAVGCLIPDSAYSNDLELKGAVDEVLSREPASAPEYDSIRTDMEKALKAAGVDPARDRELLGALQRVHDNRFPTDWPEALARVARAYGLNP